MSWVRKVCACEVPSGHGLGIGSVWECDKCARRWEITSVEARPGDVRRQDQIRHWTAAERAETYVYLTDLLATEVQRP